MVRENQMQQVHDGGYEGTGRLLVGTAGNHPPIKPSGTVHCILAWSCIEATWLVTRRDG